MGVSLAQQLAVMESQERNTFLASLTNAEADSLLTDWGFWARPEQLMPEGGWMIWLLLCGRGFGKSRTASETFVSWVVANPRDVVGNPTEWLLAGKSHKDTVNVLLRGPSGVFAVLQSRGIEYHWNKNEHLITLDTGQRIHHTHGDDEDLGRGLNLAGAAVDELGTWRRVLAAMKEGLVPALRAMVPDWSPRLMIATTPKIGSADALSYLKELNGRFESGDAGVVVTRGTTFDNAANLSPALLAEYEAAYPKGSRAYRQELLAELLDEVEGALWKWDQIQGQRSKQLPELWRRTVAVDPAVTSGPDSDETGIVVSASGRPVGADVDHYFVLEDKSSRYTMSQWPVVAVTLAHKWDAEILVEIDQGGEMNEQLLQDAARDLGMPVRVRTVRARSEGSKAARATPVVALYEAGRVHHHAEFEHLEAQMTTWVPGVDRKSPDRIDALVYTIRDLHEDKNTFVAVPVTRAY